MANKDAAFGLRPVHRSTEVNLDIVLQQQMLLIRLKSTMVTL